MDDVKLFKAFQSDPILFIEKVWHLTPQPLKPEFQTPQTQYTKDMFEPYIKGKHITWQQWVFLMAVKEALAGNASKHISVASGHGIGKSTTLSWLVIWYLFCFKDAQVPCTAPTSTQMHDILWKEIAKWLKKMPTELRDKFEWTSEYVRVTESPETWFARAKTAKKESPEALAGVHGDFVMYLVDEASGVPEEVFNTAEGALTNTNILFIMISNPTRLTGYFYDSHHKDKNAWQTFQFSSIDSPIVDAAYVERIVTKHGEESDEYRFRVLGQFPKEDGMDDKGYMPLFAQDDLKFTNRDAFAGTKKMGIDPAGEGTDETVWVIRDRFIARVVAREKTSNEKSIAQKTLTLMEHYSVEPQNITIDNFGVGANVAQELALSGLSIRVNGINVGESADDSDKFLNHRSEAYWRSREWVKRGGEFTNDDGWQELLVIKYARNLAGKLQIMPKRDMRKLGIKSPNVADAFMLTFVKEDTKVETVDAFDQAGLYTTEYR